MKRKGIYIGKDPNLKYLKCKIIKQSEDTFTLVIKDSILGRVEFEAKKSEII